jgi:hypothetical protein
MTEQELWLKNERDHSELKADLVDIKESLAARGDVATLIINRVCLPLILSLSAIIGTDRILSKFLGV